MIDVKNVSFSVGGSRKILDSVSFRVLPEEFLAITGPNGSGKSTLAKIIMGLLKFSSGQIFWQGEEISGLSVSERAKRGISYSFQQPVKFKGLTVHELLCIASGELISPRDAGEFLRKVGLIEPGYAYREIDSKLSGGELKRIEIATVLVRDADLMIFDEPEAGIDLWSFDDLVKLLRNLKKAGKTIIVISHQERILKIADKILVLDKGKVKEFKEARMILPKILEVRDGN